MNHLESSFSGKNNAWRYLVMLLAIFAATNTIGAIPLLITMGIRAASDPGVMGSLAANPSDLSSLGINPNLYLFEMLFPFIIGLVAFILLLKPLNGKTLKEVINGTGKIRWKKILISALVWVFFSAIYLFVSILINPDNFVLSNTTKTLIPLIIISVVFIPFQAAWEEIVFRGYLMQGFTVWVRNRWAPVIFTSILFALMHIINPEIKEYGFWNMMPQYLLFGLLFGVITIFDDGVEAAIGAHAANNAFLSIMLTNKGSALQTPALYTQQTYYPGLELLMMVVMSILVLITLALVFRWKNPGLLFGRVQPPAEVVQTP